MANVTEEAIDQKLLRRLCAKLVSTTRTKFQGEAPLMEFVRARDERCQGVTSPLFKSVRDELLAKGVLSMSTEGSKPVFAINKPAAAIEQDRIDQEMRERKTGPRAKNVLAKVEVVAASAPVGLGSVSLSAEPVDVSPVAEGSLSSLPVPAFRVGSLRYTAFMIESEFVAWRRIETSVLTRGGAIDEKMRDNPFVSRLVTAGVVDEDRKRFLIHPSRIQVVRIEGRDERGLGPDRWALIRAVQRLEAELFRTRGDVYDALVASGFPVKIARPSFDTSMGVALSSGLGGLNIVVAHGKRPNWVITTTLPSFEYYKFVERAAVHSKPSATESLIGAVQVREETPTVDVERILEDRPEIHKALTEEALAIASRIHSGEERTYTLAELIARRDALIAEATKLTETIAIREREVAEEKARLETEEAELLAKLETIRARKAELK